MNSDRRNRIREHIETLKTIKESLQGIQYDEMMEWKHTPESIKTKTMFFNHMEVLADLREAVSQIELSIWDLEHTEVNE